MPLAKNIPFSYWMSWQIIIKPHYLMYCAVQVSIYIFIRISLYSTTASTWLFVRAAATHSKWSILIITVPLSKQANNIFTSECSGHGLFKLTIKSLLSSTSLHSHSFIHWVSHWNQNQANQAETNTLLCTSLSLNHAYQYSSRVCWWVSRSNSLDFLCVN